MIHLSHYERARRRQYYGSNPEHGAGSCAVAVDNARLYRCAQEANRAKEERLTLLKTLRRVIFLTGEMLSPEGREFLDRMTRGQSSTL